MSRKDENYAAALSAAIGKIHEMNDAGMFNTNKSPRKYSCKNQFNWKDTVDGNPRAAYTEAHPYTGNVTISGKVGINGRTKGCGTFGD